MSQGSVRKLLRCGGILSDHFNANLLSADPVIHFEYLMLYDKSSVANFWDTLYIQSLRANKKL